MGSVGIVHGIEGASRYRWEAPSSLADRFNFRVELRGAYVLCIQLGTEVSVE